MVKEWKDRRVLWFSYVPMWEFGFHRQEQHRTEQPPLLATGSPCPQLSPFHIKAAHPMSPWRTGETHPGTNMPPTTPQCVLQPMFPCCVQGWCQKLVWSSPFLSVQKNVWLCHCRRELPAPCKSLMWYKFELPSLSCSVLTAFWLCIGEGKVQEFIMVWSCTYPGIQL